MQPFERGFGHILGNALRRILLSSMNGFAPTEVAISGVLHEYSNTFQAACPFRQSEKHRRRLPYIYCGRWRCHLPHRLAPDQSSLRSEAELRS